MTKIISLSDEAYKRLFAIKGADSFSKVVIRITTPQKKKSLASFAGTLKDCSNDLDKAFNEIFEDRKKFKFKEVNL